jgi:hypothetical protein
MLNDVDLKYADGVITTPKGLATTGALSGASLGVSGAATLGSLTVGGQAYAVNPSQWQAEDYGLISWSSDPSIGTSTTNAVTNGTIYLSALKIRRATTITNVHWAPGTAGVTPTSGQNFAALVNSSGVILSSVGIDALVTTAGGNKPVAVLGAPQAVGVGTVWVALLFNASTPPVLLRTSGQQTGTNNYGLTAATYRYAINGTGATALPGSFTMGANTVGPSLWVAVS